MKPVNVPPKFAKVRDALVSFAHGEAPEPKASKTLEEFQGWLLYENGDLDVDPVSFVNLWGLEFTDDDVRDDLGLKDEEPLSDNQRLAFARAYIDGFDDSGSRSPTFPIFFLLRRADGKETLYCATSDGGGQGGLYETWQGCFPTLEGLYDSLRDSGYWLIGDDSSKIPDERIMAQWYFPKEAKR